MTSVDRGSGGVQLWGSASGHVARDVGGWLVIWKEGALLAWCGVCFCDVWVCAHVLLWLTTPSATACARHSSNGESKIIPVNTTVGRSGMVLITLKSQDSIPPYRVENRWAVRHGLKGCCLYKGGGRGVLKGGSEVLINLTSQHSIPQVPGPASHYPLAWPAPFLTPTP